MLLLAGKTENVMTGKKILHDLLESGQALNKFIEFICAQGGDPRVAREDGILPAAKFTAAVPAPGSGCVQGINAEVIGRSAMLLGAGRENKDSQIDLSAGIVLNKKVGDPVKTGETLAVAHANSTEQLAQVKDLILSAYKIGIARPAPGRLLLGTVPETI
jgi:thymidine phosphorylase